METGEIDEYSKSNVLSLNSPEIIDDKDEDSSIFSNEQNDVLPELKKGLPSEANGILNNSKDEKSKGCPRRVSFPDGDKIISGYGEPRNPWAHAETTSTEELIQAYTQSCQHWGVKPITKLLVQLQEIRDFSVRANSLTLKGEKLDSKVVETLEAVFKRVQFVIMDLEATNLDDDSAAALFDMIEYYESAVNVLVGFNKNLGTRGWQAAAHMMRKMSCLRLFDGHSVPLSEQAVPFVGRALRLSNTLVTLHLENASISGRPMLLIVAALRMNITLRELFLADNRLISTDALQLANLLKSNMILQLLDIRNNLIQDAGLCHICSGLMSQPQHGIGGLQTLVLWNNQISHQSMARLGMALRNTTSLSTLNLGQNVLSDDGAARLKEGLLQNHSLLRLGLVGTKLTCEGAIALAEYLAETPRIIRLDLRNNNIRVGGLMALSLAFKINYSLLRLDIDKPNGKESLKELAEKQDALLNDMTEYSTRNKEQAYQRVLNIQMERQRKSEEEKTDGLRYMDMTHSARAVHPQFVVGAASASSNNNSNRLLENGRKSEGEAAFSTDDVDDSPINSPEMLPTSSVSYHQVAPVMFSSSEMEKRASLTTHKPPPDSDMPVSQTKDEENAKEELARDEAQEEKEDHIPADQEKVNPVDEDFIPEEKAREDALEEKSEQDNSPPVEDSKDASSSVIGTREMETDTNNGEVSTSVENNPPDAEVSSVPSAETVPLEEPPTDETASGSSDPSTPDATDDVTKVVTSQDSDDVVVAGESPAEDGVVISHFDLSLFPH